MRVKSAIKTSSGIAHTKGVDAFYISTWSAPLAADLLTNVAYRYGYRVVLINKKNGIYQYIDDPSNPDQSKYQTTKYIFKRLSALDPKRARPTKKTFIQFYDLRRGTVTLAFDCYIRKADDNINHNRYICEPFEVITNMEELA
jgi:hypothetical protein